MFIFLQPTNVNLCITQDIKNKKDHLMMVLGIRVFLGKIFTLAAYKPA